MNRTWLPASRDRSMTAMHALTGVVAAATVASTGAITGLAAADTAQQQALKAQAKAAAAQQTAAEIVDRTYRTVVSESVTTAAATGGSLSPSPKPKTSASPGRSGRRMPSPQPPALRGIRRGAGEVRRAGRGSRP